MSVEDPWQEIDEALGLRSRKSSSMVQYFREAGFNEDEAGRGVELMESGRYDVAPERARRLSGAGGGQRRPAARHEAHGGSRSRLL